MVGSAPPMPGGGLPSCYRRRRRRSRRHPARSWSSIEVQSPRSHEGDVARDRAGVGDREQASNVVGPARSAGSRRRRASRRLRLRRFPARSRPGRSRSWPATAAGVVTSKCRCPAEAGRARGRHGGSRPGEMARVRGRDHTFSTSSSGPVLAGRVVSRMFRSKMSGPGLDRAGAGVDLRREAEAVRELVEQHRDQIDLLRVLVVEAVVPLEPAARLPEVVLISSDVVGVFLPGLTSRPERRFASAVGYQVPANSGPGNPALGVKSLDELNGARVRENGGRRTLHAQAGEARLDSDLDGAVQDSGPDVRRALGGMASAGRASCRVSADGCRRRRVVDTRLAGIGVDDRDVGAGLEKARARRRGVAAARPSFFKSSILLNVGRVCG